MIKKENLIIAAFTIAILLFANAYVFFGILFPKNGMEFLGRRVTNSQDTYTYVAFIEQAKQGRVFFENLYSSDPQTQTLIRPSYSLLGGIAVVLQLSSIEAYHVGRILFSIFFCYVLYIFLGLYFNTFKRRFLAYAVILSSCGIGFIVGRFGIDSSDLWIPESITFLSLQEAPHFALSQALMVLSFYFLIKVWVEKNTKKLIFVILPLLLLGFEHPYNLFVCLVTVVLAGIYLLLSKKVSQRLVFFGILTVIAGVIFGNVYQLFELYRNPILKSWAFQSDSPIPLTYIFGYGLLTIFAFIGIEKYLREKRIPQIFILSWIASSAILLYSPVYFQRRMSEGFHIPVSILAAEGIITFSLFAARFSIQKTKKVVTYFLAGFIVAIMSIGLLLGVYAELTTINNDYQKNYYYYLLTQEVNAAKYLRQVSLPQDVILSNWFYGNVLPGLIGRKVYIGHQAQTNDFEKKVERVNKFLLNKNANEAYKFLKDNNITYIFVGKNDTLSSYGFKPQEKPYLEKVFDDREAKVYRVK